MDKNPTFQPCGYYYRTAIREAKTLADLRTIALILLDELEEHRAEFRRLGMWPPVKHDPQEVTGPFFRPQKEEPRAGTEEPPCS